MKFLLFGALLIGSTLCQSTPHRYEELIGKLNFERRLFAERMNISNMYELHWDEKLNPILWPEYRSPNSSFREMLIGRDQNAIASEVYVLDQLLIEIHNDSGRERFWEIMNVSIDSNRWPYWPFEHFLPTQTSIACDSRENMYRWESPWKGSNLYRTICYLGPENSYKKTMNWKKGWPGSACGCDTNVEGLCRPRNLVNEGSQSIGKKDKVLTKLNF